jgi:TonB family protein
MTSPTFNNGYSGKDPNFYNMILLSLVAHFMVITIVLVSLPSASRHLTFGPVYSVSLVSSDVVLSRNQKSSLIKEIEKSGEAANSVIYKKEISRLAATPIKKEETDRMNIEKAISAIRRKELSAPEPSSSFKKEETNRMNIEKAISAIRQKELAAPGMSSSSSRTNSGSRTGRMTSGEMGAKTNDYASFVSSRVHSNWSIPLELKPRGNIVTIIEIKIRRDGSLAYAGFEKRSGNSFYDDSAMKAVKKSAPFPPFPGGYPDNIMEMGIRFHPSQLR